SQQSSSQNYRDQKTNRHESQNDKQETWVQRAGDDPLAVFTLFLAIIAGAQIGLFYVQLKLIRRSLDTAKESADTAKTQAEIAQATLKAVQDTAKRQLRAYISITPTDVNEFYEGGNVTLHYDTKNIGQTPAVKVRTFAGVGIFPFPLPRGLPMPRLNEDPNKSVQTIFPGDYFSQDCELGRTLTANDIIAIKQGDKCRLYIIAVAKYVDTFGEDRYTEICASIGGPLFAKAVDNA